MIHYHHISNKSSRILQEHVIWTPTQKGYAYFVPYITIGLTLEKYLHSLF